MITIFFHMTVKPERQADFEMLAKDMMVTTRTEDGCIASGSPSVGRFSERLAVRRPEAREGTGTGTE